MKPIKRDLIAVMATIFLGFQGAQQALAHEGELEAVEAEGAGLAYGPPNTEAEPASTSEAHHPLFPLGAEKARERGYKIQRAFGFSGMTIHNVENMDGQNLAINFAKGEDPPADAALIDIPFVTTDRLESHTTNSQFKADLWVLPFLNAFVAVGKVNGHMNIGVDIDLDAVIPPPICRPANPCRNVQLPFEADVDNTTLTLGTMLAYGANDWAAIATVAKTLSVSSKDRSDIETIDASIRIGPRLKIGNSAVLMPYIGGDYFNLDAKVKGIVRSGPVFADQDSINLRYRIDLSTQNPYAVINGLNLEFSPHFSIQAEYNWGASSDRFILSATIRP